MSEIMLQQTRVETVVPYFDRFLDSFPTLEALAEAPLEHVLERWSGLGYYRRARMLHAGARAVAKAGMPETAATLRAIPGIGEYTAGAIASIAFGEEAAIVDGNVARVLSRVHAIRGEGSAVRKRLWSLAAELVRGEDPGALNQALMELGATVCTPRAPSCEACPLAKGCRALAEGIVDSIPPAKKRARVKTWKRIAIVAARSGTVLMARRKEHLVFGGLWEPPGVDVPTADGSGTRAVRALAARFASGTLRRAGTVRHLLSHRDLRVDVWVVDGARALRSVRLPPDYDDHMWARGTKGLALSTLAKKILATSTNR